MKALNRALIDAGLITMKDSPNGKRYGKRELPKAAIVEAYGFDLSPLAARYAEFVRLAEDARAERAEMGRLRRRATIARNGITQILETAAEYGFEGEEWLTLSRERRSLTLALRRVERPEEMALGVESLERRQRSARERLENLLFWRLRQASEAVNSDPKGPENRPHQYTYKPSLYPEQDTVMASKGVSRPRRRGPDPEPARSPARPQEPENGAGEGGREKPDPDGLRHRDAAFDRRTDVPGAAAADLSETTAPGLAGDRRCRGLAARRDGRVEIALGRGLHRDGPRAGGDRGRDRLGEAGGAFPLDAGRVFPRHGGEGEGRRTQSRAHDLGLAAGGRPETPPRAAGGQGACIRRRDPGAEAGVVAAGARFSEPAVLSGIEPCRERPAGFPRGADDPVTAITGWRHCRSGERTLPTRRGEGGHEPNRLEVIFRFCAVLR